MASYALNEAAGQARGRADPRQRQYVLRSEWNQAQPRAEAQNAYLKNHSWDEYARVAPRAHRGRHRRDQGPLRVRLRGLPPRAPDGAHRLRVPRQRVAPQGDRAGRPRPAAAAGLRQRLTALTRPGAQRRLLVEQRVRQGSPHIGGPAQRPLGAHKPDGRLRLVDGRQHQPDHVGAVPRLRGQGEQRRDRRAPGRAGRGPRRTPARPTPRSRRPGRRATASACAARQRGSTGQTTSTGPPAAAGEHARPPRRRAPRRRAATATGPALRASAHSIRAGHQQSLDRRRALVARAARAAPAAPGRAPAITSTAGGAATDPYPCSKRYMVPPGAAGASAGQPVDRQGEHVGEHRRCSVPISSISVDTGVGSPGTTSLA